MGAYARDHLTNEDLIRSCAQHLSDERGSSAHLIADLAEIDRRRMYLPAGYASMYAYCIGELKLSEDSAWRRIQVARLARRFPGIFDALANGRLHQSGAILLSPHLSDGNSESLLNAAAGRTKSQIEEIIARRFPRSEMLPMVERLSGAPIGIGPSSSPGMITRSQPAPARVNAGDTEQNASLTEHRPAEAGGHQPDAHHTEGREEPEREPLAQGASQDAGARHPIAPALRSRLEPIAAERYALHLSIGRDTHQKLVHAQELMSHSVPSGDLAEVLDRALDLLVARLEKQKFAATPNPRPAREPARSPRAIPAEVRRAVWRRDEGRCTFVSAGGRRCESRRFLEFHHVEPVAHGGPATVDNLYLRCRPHNQHEAEQALGSGFMEAKRAGTDHGARRDTPAQDSTDTAAKPV